MFNTMQQATVGLLSKIKQLPFNTELAAGTLSQDKFIFYLQQDALYLIDFSRALAMTAARLSDTETIKHYLAFALGAIDAERSLHENYLSQYGVNKQVVEPSPTCFMYCHYLMSLVNIASVAEAVAVLLPCFWVYREVGLSIAKKSAANNPYQQWIDLYSGKEFAQAVDMAIDINNQLAKKASTNEQQAMLAAFTRSTQLEWLFWHSAYQKEQWKPDFSHSPA